MKRYTLSRVWRVNAIGYTLCCILVFSSLGCDAFVRKFTRKKKKKDLAPEELVIAPEEYKGPQMSREELYREDLFLWRAWHDELLTSLSGSNHKKMVYCGDKTVESLVVLSDLLQGEKQSELIMQIDKLRGIWSEIARDKYGLQRSQHLRALERMKRDILQDFSYKKIISSLK